MSPPAWCCTADSCVIAASITGSKAVARAAAVPAAVVVAYVASARVYEGVHHPTDVIGGAVLGMGALFVAVLSTGLVVPTRRAIGVRSTGRTSTAGGDELVIVAGVVIGVGVVAGVAATAAAWRWSRSDPTDPHLERRTVRRFLREHPLVQRLARRHHPKPSAATAEALGLAAAVVVIGTAAAGAILLMIKTRSGFARADTPFAEWAAEHATEASTDVMRAISELGGTRYVVVVALAVTGIELLRDRRWAVPAFVAMTIGGQFAPLQRHQVDRRPGTSHHRAADRVRGDVVPVGSRGGGRGDLDMCRVPPGPAPTPARPCGAAGRRGRDRRRRRRHARRARGALDDGRDRRAARRLDVVRAVRDRVRWAGAALRRTGRGRRGRSGPAGRRPHHVTLRRRRRWPQLAAQSCRRLQPAVGPSGRLRGREERGGVRPEPANFASAWVAANGGASTATSPSRVMIH